MQGKTRKPQGAFTITPGENDIGEQPNVVTIPGTVTKVRFKNMDNGWGVVTLRTEEGNEITAAGQFAGVREKDSVNCTGCWDFHKKYGRQLKVLACVPQQPDPASKEAVLIYMKRHIKGIGPSTGEAIWAAFGQDTLDKLKGDEKAIATVVGKKRAKKFCAEARRHVEDEKDALLEGEIMVRFGIGPSLAAKVHDRYKDNAIRAIEENPYRITEIEGAGFATAEKFAIKSGITRDAPERIQAGVRYVVQESETEGHTRLPDDEVIKRAMSLLKDPVQQEQIETAVCELAKKGKILHVGKAGEGWTCLPEMHRMEETVAEAMVDLKGEREYDREVAEKALKAAEEEGIHLNSQQEDAVFTALGNGLTIITGGPGTGKTTFINALIRCLEALDKLKEEDPTHVRSNPVLLCAPTGRAAKRMGEATGREARTIHRALEFKSLGNDEENGGMRGKFTRDALNPLEESTIIVDEMSMVDAPLAAALIAAVKKGCRLVLVGDTDQLPSVGPGSVFRDAIASDLFPVVRLVINYRQEAGSSIVTNAARVNSGRLPEGTNRLEGDFYMIACEDEQMAADRIITQMARGIPRKGIPAEGMQVICPMKKGATGTTALNEAIRERTNPLSDGKQEITVAGQIYREGDRVMQSKNNYKMEWELENGDETGVGVFNGDTGQITQIDREERTATILFDDGRVSEYRESDMDQLIPAWAITVHKSQGSEYQAVIIPLMWGPPSLMTRGLLYTAITRAKKCVLIIGRKKTLAQMVRNNYERKRYTGLKDILLDQDVFESSKKEHRAALKRKQGNMGYAFSGQEMEGEWHPPIRRNADFAIPGQENFISQPEWHI